MFWDISVTLPFNDGTIKNFYPPHKNLFAGIMGVSIKIDSMRQKTTTPFGLKKHQANYLPMV
jgi:hypothetical protein